MDTPDKKNLPQQPDVVPVAGKSAARPSQAEHQQELHEYPATDAEALRQEGLEPREEDYHIIEDETQPPR